MGRKLRTAGRVAAVALGVTALGGMLGAGGVAAWLAAALRLVAGRRPAPVGAPVEIVRDREGIPHIRAGSEADAYFALGWVHAQDRLWQMDLGRRVAAGRLSELLGERTLGIDRLMRALGLHRAAERDLAALDPATRQLLERYAEGVNAAVRDHGGPLPPEYTVLGAGFEPWQPADSLARLKTMAWLLGKNWESELQRRDLLRGLEPRQVAELFAPYPGDEPIDLAAAVPDAAGLAGRLLAASRDAAGPADAGSNAWAVSGRLTASGRPLMANDPHLTLEQPATWYFVHLEAPGLTVAGASLAGVPGVILGHNGTIAWGTTNGRADVQDFFIERAAPDDPASYLVPGGTARFETREEVIGIRGRPPETMHVRATRHGPVLSDVLRDMGRMPDDGEILALSWTALTGPDRTMRALLRLPHARDWQQFVDVLRDFDAPQQNVVYADTAGNIGMILPGRIPLRGDAAGTRGTVPVPGWEAGNDWLGYVPFDDLPRVLNPPEGRVVTANHKAALAEDPGFWLTSEWAPPYRARRIEDLLTAHDRHTRETFRAIQNDAVSLRVREILPFLRAALPDDEQGRRVRDLLDGWEGEMAADLPQPLLTAAWLRELERAVYADELGPRFAAYWDHRPLFLLNVLSDAGGQSRWCDDVGTPAPEDCDTVLRLALGRALDTLGQAYGHDPARWRWGDAHPAVAPHRPFSSIPGLNRFYALETASSGDPFTVNVGGHRIADPERPFANVHAANPRLIYDLDDLSTVEIALFGGQSALPLSPHAGTLASRWQRGDYAILMTDRSRIEAEATARLVLEPAKRES
jgi:penicillin amidase